MSLFSIQLRLLLNTNARLLHNAILCYNNFRVSFYLRLALLLMFNIKSQSNRMLTISCKTDPWSALFEL